MARDATIRIKRASADWRDRARSYKVVMDHERVGRIGNGETLDIPTSPGTHNLRLKIDWSGSRELSFSVRSGEMRVFSATPVVDIAVADLIRSFFQHDQWITLTDDGPANSRERHVVPDMASPLIRKLPPQVRMEGLLLLFWFVTVGVLAVVGLLERHARFARWDGAIILVAIFVPATLIQFQRWRGRR